MYGMTYMDIYYVAHILAPCTSLLVTTFSPWAHIYYVWKLQFNWLTYKCSSHISWFYGNVCQFVLDDIVAELVWELSNRKNTTIPDADELFMDREKAFDSTGRKRPIHMYCSL